MFRFKKFDVKQESNAQKVGTDSMILGAWISSLRISPKKILDIGTGTGVLALMAAQSFVESNVHAIEIDGVNEEEAKRNFRNSDFSDRIVSYCTSLDSYSPSTEFDLIISNPPYFLNSLKSGDLAKDVARHEDSLPMQDLVSFVSQNMSENGEFAVVYPASLQEKFVKLFESLDIHLVKCLRTIHKGQGVRSFMLFSRKNQRLLLEELTVRAEDGSYSEEYKRLTKEFHFNKL